MRATSGFTLLELLVVLLLLGIVTMTGALLTSPPRGLTDQNDSLALLATRLSLSADEAALGSSVLGVAFSESSYMFLERDDDGAWRPVSAERLAGDHQVPGSFELVFDGNRRPIRRSLSNAQTRRPDVQIDAIGEWPTFEIRLTDRQAGRSRVRNLTQGRPGQFVVSTVTRS